MVFVILEMVNTFSNEHLFAERRAYESSCRSPSPNVSSSPLGISRSKSNQALNCSVVIPGWGATSRAASNLTSSASKPDFRQQFTIVLQANVFHQVTIVRTAARRFSFFASGHFFRLSGITVQIIGAIGGDFRLPIVGSSILPMICSVQQW